MNRRFIAAAVLLLLVASAFAHRLDEYLQATIISLDNNHVQASMRLVPGVAVASTVLADIDANGDGVLSQPEQQTYAERVLHDLTITVDGQPANPMLVSQKFPPVEEIRAGLGEIQIEFTFNLPPGGPDRKIIFENHHLNKISAYLVNCLAPRDPGIRIITQSRNETQSFYQLDYTQSGAASGSASAKGWFNIPWRMGAVGFASLFHLGMRHIAEGTDHLLFLLALLLPAPLLVSGARWAGFAGVRPSLLRILKVVTAFTLGHSITLALAALGVVHVPSRPIEVLIALSILVSAVHALRPLFPGKEAGIAAFFGLIHGLAFAATLDQLGLGRWERVGGILAFNLGIETMQLIVVAAAMPFLVLMSRTRAYPFLRIGGALFAAVASLGWIAERLFGAQNPVGIIVESVAHHAVWIAVMLFLVSLICWLLAHVLKAKPQTSIITAFPMQLKKKA
ncbi:MAG TPA: HupE/UreJ family protein [Candidatus Angelobacter sp.]|nr:HupE/UreJ family protein [Candidatus Angelobacter sp.]